jgi:excisionase family DNA binding protein
MKSRLQDLLDSPERVREVPLDSVPGLLAQLGGPQVILAARLIDSETHVVKRPLDDPKPHTLITVYQAAERLSFTTQYVYELMRNGQLQAIRNGKYVRILNSDLDAWIERNRE